MWDRMTPEELMLERETVTTLRAALRELNPRERLLLSRRYGLFGKRPLSMQEISERTERVKKPADWLLHRHPGLAQEPVSRERVRQIHDKAIRKLRRALGWTVRQ